MRAAPTALYDIDPNLHREVIAEPVVKARRWPTCSTPPCSADWAKGKPGQNLANAIDVVAMSLFGKRFRDLGPAGTPKTPREIELERQLAGRTARTTPNSAPSSSRSSTARRTTPR
jgi:hypothetical protein